MCPRSLWRHGSLAQVFFAVAGIQPYSIEQTPLAQILFPLFLFTLSYFLLNSWLVTIALALQTQKPPFAIWRDNFLWLSRQLLRRWFSCRPSRHLYARDRFNDAGNHCSTAADFLSDFQDDARAHRGREPPPYRSQQNVSLDHRNFSDGDRCEGSNHARTHPSRAAVGRRSGQVRRRQR